MNKVIVYFGKSNCYYENLYKKLYKSIHGDSKGRENQRIVIGYNFIKGRGDLKSEFFSITCFDNPKYEPFEKFTSKEPVAYIEIYGIDIKTSGVEIRILDDSAGQNILQIIRSTRYVEFEEESQAISNLKWKKKNYLGFNQIKLCVLTVVVNNYSGDPVPNKIYALLKNFSAEHVDELLKADGAFIQLLEDSKRIKSTSKTWKREKLNTLKMWGLSKKTIRQFWKDEHIS